MKTTIVFAAPRRLLGVALVLVGVLATSCDKDKQNVELQAAAPVATQVNQDATTYPYIGSLGNSQDDGDVKAIINEISGFWGKYPRRVTITTATNIPNFLAGCDKSLTINKNFFYDVKKKFPVDREFRIALRGILAHEFGHILQYSYVTNFSVYERQSPELEADFFAGVYLGSIWGANYNQTNLRISLRFFDYYSRVEDLPVTCFSTKPMYGTSCQRVSATSAGWFAGSRYQGPIVGDGIPKPNFTLFRSTLVTGIVYGCLANPNYAMPAVGSPYVN